MTATDSSIFVGPYPAPTPTLWGLSPVKLHDQLWTGVGVQVVRAQTPWERSAHGTYLLAGREQMVAFRFGSDLVCRVERNRAALIRLSGIVMGNHPERIVLSPDGEFERIERRYAVRRAQFGRCLLTRDVELALRWSEQGFCLREMAARKLTIKVSVYGGSFRSQSAEDVAGFVQLAPLCWERPAGAVGAGVVHRGNGVWVGQTSTIETAATAIGPVWVGDGWKVTDDTAALLGPTILWDAESEKVGSAGTTGSMTAHQQYGRICSTGTQLSFSDDRSRQVTGKRLFDVFFALMALAITLPFYPLIWLAIWMEDGRPFFYGQWREGRRGRPFRCWKIRSMRKDADLVKRQLAEQNQADGPQFFMRKDPRLTRVGRVLRRLNVDEWPQFWNVLKGEMSVIGPRPSPRQENQCCPPWREARLSVRPGITGLWQVKRTRQAGTDFQEWIRYDIEYVDHVSWVLDLTILLLTFRSLLPKKGSDQ